MASISDIKNTDFSSILTNTHKALYLKMQRNTNKKAAKELQSLLQEIKKTAQELNNYSNDPVTLRLKQDYEDLINTAFSLQKVYHGSGFKASTLFRRKSSTKTIQEADNIFEEDLAAILAASELLGGNKNISIQQFLTGTKTAGLKSIDILNSKELDEKVLKLINELANKENQRIKEIKAIKETTGKIDVQGTAITLNYSVPLNDKIERLMVLMKDATFSAKQYSSYSYSENKFKNFSSIGLQLGNTNLYKSITGALSEIYRSPKIQTYIFFRGMNTIKNNCHGYGDMTREHFIHLKFIYELRGSGLLDSDGRIKNVKYIIYNDPSSDAIFVKDTASIVLDALDSAYKKSNLFGTIYLPASKTLS